jgi:hypothetical protein
MRALLLLPLLLGMAACQQSLQSKEPLLTGSGPAPAEGLWALLAPGCAAPTSAEVQNWAACASPAWVKGSTFTIIVQGPVRSEFAVAAGDPALAQVRSDDGYTYYAVRADGPAPARAARLWALPCSEEAELDACDVKGPADLRTAARAAVARPPTWTAVLVQPTA